MAYIGGRYRVWVYEDDLDISVRMIDNIETESQARAIANCEWVKPDTKAVKITRNLFDSHKRRAPKKIAAVIKKSKEE